ncbi:MAG: regulatory protein RecX [Phycisphaeraceae bacterium]|nr:regulatory protein RecX [Phycisphaeraceae bacterium]
MPSRKTEPESFDDLIGATITALVPSQRDPMRIAIRVGRRSLGTIDRGAISELGLRKGAEVDEALIRRVRAAAQAQACKSKALRLLSFKPRSRKRLIDDLRRAGFEPALAEATADRMVESGLVNDAQLAEVLAQEIVARKPAGQRFLTVKLRQRGFEQSLSEDVARRIAGERDTAADALRLAQKQARTLPAGIAPDAARRRIFGALARRGFDMDTARQAVDEALRHRSEAEGTA